jgi:hypothetical protein
MSTHAEHNPADIDPHNPINEKPFWKWLESHGGATGKFIADLRTYLNVSEYAKGFLTRTQLEAYKVTYQWFWECKHKGRLDTHKDNRP